MLTHKFGEVITTKNFQIGQFLFLNKRDKADFQLFCRM